MTFKYALESLKRGEKIKLPHWKGYWKLENGRVEMYCKNGTVLDLQNTDDIVYTLSDIASDEWEVAENDYEIAVSIQTFRFGEAVRLMKQGKKLKRIGWNGTGMFVVYQKGYPNGIPCNAQTAKAWGINEGDLFKCNPYLQIRCADGSHSMWVPSINDLLSEDWVISV